MSRAHTPPSYLRHRGGDGRLRARTAIRWPDGRVEHRSLGHWGSPESHAAHQEAVSQWRAAWDAAARGEPVLQAGDVHTITELLARFWLHAGQHYRDADGSPKSELASFKFALRPLRRLYGTTPVADFGPRAFKALRQSVLSGSWLTDDERAKRRARGLPLDWSRKFTNRNMVRVKTVFAWAVEEELVPGELLHRLRAVRGLPEAAAGARETDDVAPVPETDLAATLAELGPVVRAMARVQLLTGMRPGEVVRLLAEDLQRSGEIDLGKGIVLDARKVWSWLPRHHKTRHKNVKRVILFGPQAQEILAPFLAGRLPGKHLFSPREAVEERLRNLGRTIHHAPTRCPGEQYTVSAYGHAIAAAAARAGVPHWAPNQLRHNAATHLVKQFGWNVARIVLGHKHLQTTRIYALDDVQAAVDAIGEAG